MARKHPKRKDRPGVDRYGRTELHNAVIDGDADKARTLVAAGARVDVADDEGWTPLHYAAHTQSRAIAELLLAARAPIDAQDLHGNTPLSTAVFESRGRGDLITLLRQHGADPIRENNYGVSPVSLARTIANYDVAQYFRDVPDQLSGAKA
jgi:ankyrin repeat protein